MTTKATKEKATTKVATKLPIVLVNIDNIHKFTFASPVLGYCTNFSVEMPSGEKIHLAVTPGSSSIGTMVDYFPFIVEKKESCKALKYDCFFGKKGEVVEISSEVITNCGLQEEDVYSITYTYKLVGIAHFSYRNEVAKYIKATPLLKSIM